MLGRNRVTHQVDWLLFNLRWLLLVAVGVVGLLAPDVPGRDPLVIIALLMAAAAYNLAVLLLITLGLWPRILPILALIVDCLLAIAIFQVSGWGRSPLIWVGLFPILTAALRYGWISSLAVAGVILAAEAVLVLAFDPGGVGELVPFSFNALFLLGAAGLTGVVGDRVRSLAVRQVEAEHAEEERKIRAIRERSRAIFEMVTLVSATLNYEKVLDAALDLGAMGMEDLGAASAQMVSAALLIGGDSLHVATARRLTPTDMKTTASAREGLLAEAVRTGEPRRTAQPYRDPEIAHYVAFRGCRSLVAVPLQAGFETYGLIVFGHPQENFFSPDHIELIESVCKQATIALQNATLYRSLLDEKDRIVEVEEEARKKLARDLHDGPTQSIAAIAMRVNYARRLLERDPQQTAEELFKIEDLARRTTKEIRHMLFTLRPLILESQGLTAALRQLADKARDTHGQNVMVEAGAGVEDRLEMNQKGVLFYIVEEAINNARKHAEAEHIWVRLRLRSPDVLALEVQDDGVGFDVGRVDAAYEQRGSLGMVNMRERAELVSGWLHIDSAEGKGTKITVFVPLTEEARDRLRV